MEDKTKTDTKPLNAAISQTISKLPPVDYKDLESLIPGKHINNVILDFGLHKVFEDAAVPSSAVLLPYILWNRVFAVAESEISEAAIKRAVKLCLINAPENNVLKIKYLVVPLHGGDSYNHWSIAVICNPFPDTKLVNEMTECANKLPLAPKMFMEQLYTTWLLDPASGPVIHIMDSFIEKNECKGGVIKLVSKIHQTWYDSIQRGLICIHRKLWNDTNQNIELPEGFYNKFQIRRCTIKVPAQTNSSDCGINAMNNVLAFFSRLQHYGHHAHFRFNQDDIFENFSQYEDRLTRKKLFMELLSVCKEDNPALVNEMEAFRKIHFQ